NGNCQGYACPRRPLPRPTHTVMSFLPPTLLALAALSLGDGPPGDVDYLRDVKPILASHCYTCHGAIKQKGGLRLDTATLLRDGGDTGPVVVPGKGEGPLLDRLLGKNGLSRMPPESEGDALKPAQIAAIRRWIERGMPAP